MTGQGGVINANGSFAIGNSTANIASDGTTVVLNGFAHGNSQSYSSASFPPGSTFYLLNGSSQFNVTKPGLAIVSCSGYYYGDAVFTTGIFPTSVNVNFSFYLDGAPVHQVQSTMALISNGGAGGGGTNYQWAFPFSISFLSNLTVGVHSLTAQYNSSNPLYMSASGAPGAPYSYIYYLTTTSYWYQIS